MLYATANAIIFFLAATPEQRRWDVGHFRRFATPIARGSGNLINYNAAFLLLLSSRMVLTWLRNTPLNMVVPFDKAMPAFHMLVGYVLLVAAFVHTIAHGVTYFVGNLWAPGYTGTTSLFGTGCALLVLFSILGATSVKWMRTRRYEVFFYSHAVCAVGFFSLLLIHGLHHSKPHTYKFVVGPLLIYVLDRAARLAQEKRCSLVVSTNAGAVKGDSMLCLRLPRTFHYVAGQYAEIRVPSLSTLEWHPFTIASAPHESEMVFYVKKSGDWTTRLYDLFATGNADDVIIHVRGPYGSPAQHVGQFEHVLCIGGGVGATPFASVVKAAHHWMLNWTTRGAALGDPVGLDRNTSARTVAALTAATSAADVGEGGAAGGAGGAAPPPPPAGASMGIKPCGSSSKRFLHRVGSSRRALSPAGPSFVSPAYLAPSTSRHDLADTVPLADVAAVESLAPGEAAAAASPAAAATPSAELLLSRSGLDRRAAELAQLGDGGAAAVGAAAWGAGVSPAGLHSRLAAAADAQADGGGGWAASVPGRRSSEEAREEAELSDLEDLSSDDGNDGDGRRYSRSALERAAAAAEADEDDVESVHTLHSDASLGRLLDDEDPLPPCYTAAGAGGGGGGVPAPPPAPRGPAYDDGLDELESLADSDDDQTGYGDEDEDDSRFDSDEEACLDNSMDSIGRLLRHSAFINSTAGQQLIGLSFGSAAMLRHLKRGDAHRQRHGGAGRRTSVLGALFGGSKRPTGKAQGKIGSRKRRRSTLAANVVRARTVRVALLQGLHSVSFSLAVVWTVLGRYTIAALAAIMRGFSPATTGLAMYKVRALVVADLGLASAAAFPLALSVFCEASVLGPRVYAKRRGSLVDAGLLVPLALAGVAIDFAALAGYGSGATWFGVVNLAVLWPTLLAALVYRLARVAGSRLLLAQNVRSSHSATRSLDFVWTAPTQADDGWLVEELLPLCQSGTVRLHRHITRVKKEAAVEEAWTRDYQRVPLATTYRRPEWDQLFTGIVERSRSGTVIGIFFCGPPVMSKAIQDAAQRAMAASLAKGYRRGAIALDEVKTDHGDEGGEAPADGGGGAGGMPTVKSHKAPAAAGGGADAKASRYADSYGANVRFAFREENFL